MLILNNLQEWTNIRKQFPSNCSIGFVPTMGNLHAGHASLIQTSRCNHDYTIVSIFVNPTQFNKLDDFRHYPRTQEQDLHLLETLQVDYCLIPEETIIYNDHYRYQIHEIKTSHYLEGAHRPNHFHGVLTVVMKLLNIVQPHIAYFGEKDYQQFELIRDMVNAFFIPIKIQACPTIREASGLACSSRNNRLSASEKLLAEKFAKLFHQPQYSCDFIKQQLQQLEMQIDYIEDYQQRRFAAVQIGKIRLIDNYIILK